MEYENAMEYENGSIDWSLLSQNIGAISFQRVIQAALSNNQKTTHILTKNE